MLVPVPTFPVTARLSVIRSAQCAVRAIQGLVKGATRRARLGRLLRWQAIPDGSPFGCEFICARAIHCCAELGGGIEEMPIAAGTKLGASEIVALSGSGGVQRRAELFEELKQLVQ